MTDTYQVQRRSVLGKRVATLRREGVLPANIYGRAQESMAVQLSYVDARNLLNAHGLNTLVNIHVEGEGEARPVVIRNVELEPVGRKILHLDMYQVDLSRIIKATVPVVLTGDSPAVQKFGGVLIHALDHPDFERRIDHLEQGGGRGSGGRRFADILCSQSFQSLNQNRYAPHGNASIDSGDQALIDERSAKHHGRRSAAQCQRRDSQ